MKRKIQRTVNLGQFFHSYNEVRHFIKVFVILMTLILKFNQPILAQTSNNFDPALAQKLQEALDSSIQTRNYTGASAAVYKLAPAAKASLATILNVPPVFNKRTDTSSPLPTAERAVPCATSSESAYTTVLPEILTKRLIARASPDTRDFGP